MTVDSDSPQEGANLPSLLVRVGEDVVPVIAGIDESGELTGYDIVRGNVIPVAIGDVIGAINLAPAAVYWGLDLVEKENVQRMAAEGVARDVVSLHDFATTFLANVDGGRPRQYEDDPRVKKIGAALRAIGVREVGDILGAGSFGTAAALDDHHVIKLTSDPTEVQAGAVLAGKTLRHVAHVDGAWFIRGVSANPSIVEIDGKPVRKRYPTGILVIERVDTLRSGHTRELSKLVKDIKKHNRVWPDDLSRLSHDQQRTRLCAASIDLSRSLLHAADWLRTRHNEDEARLAEDVAEALNELRDSGVCAIDAHGGNVGYVENDNGEKLYKLFDIGSSSPPDHPEAKYADAKGAKKLKDAGIQLSLPGMLDKGSVAAEWIGEGANEVGAEEAPRKLHVRYAPRGYKFAPMPSPLFGGDPIVTGFTKVRSQLIKHREKLPSLATIQISTVFAGMTIRVRFSEAEKGWRCVANLYEQVDRHRLPDLDDIDRCLVPLGLIVKRREMYSSSQEWAKLVRMAMERGLKDRELRRYLYLETELPQLIKLAKLSFTLELLGQNVACLDARILKRMYGAAEGDRLAGVFSGEVSTNVLTRYEAVEDAFVANNPFFRKDDPIGVARCQWQSWESATDQPRAESHETWLHVVR
jgi:hypothetical protein